MSTVPSGVAYPARIVLPHEGIAAENPSEKSLLKLTSDQTGGQFLFAEIEVQPGGGPPYHVHEHEDELFYVLEGEVEFMIDGKVTLAGPGTTVFGPRGIPHRFRGAGTGPARFLGVVTGTNFERFYARYEGLMADGTFTEARAIALAAEHGIQFLREPEV